MKKFTSLFALLSCLCVVSAQAVEIENLTIAGSFNNWRINEFYFSKPDPNVNEWTINWNLTGQADGVTFKFLANGEWIGNDIVGISSPGNKWIGSDGTNYKLNHTGFKTYKITASWDNTVSNPKDGWTFSIEGVDPYSFTVIGPESVFGSDWNLNDSNNEMAVNTNGYSFVLTKLVSGIQSFEYKVVKEHAYLNGEYPSSGNWNYFIQNYSPNVLYEVKIIFYPYDYGHECFVTPIKLDITDGTSFSSEGNFNVASASYSRNISNQWGTLCLPFAITTPPSGVKFYELSAVNETARTLSFEQISTVGAGQPVVFKAENVSTLEITSNNASVTPTITPVTDQTNGWVLNGSYSEQRVTGTNLYYISNNQFWLSNDYIDIPAYRAWFVGTALPSQSSQEAPFRITTDDTEGLQFVEQEDGTVKAYYDLQGRKIDGTRKGLVIENGKIIMVK